MCSRHLKTTSSLSKLMTESSVTRSSTAKAMTFVVITGTALREKHKQSHHVNNESINAINATTVKYHPHF